MPNQHTVYIGDNLAALKSLPTGSVDYVCTDPPYALVAGQYKGDGKHKKGFLGHAWDNSLPPVKTLKQILRVMKPGAFATFFCAARSDLQSAFGANLQKAGFYTAFSPLYWCYASGQLQATNMAKSVDKRLGMKGELLEILTNNARNEKRDSGGFNSTDRTKYEVRGLASGEAKALDGAFAGFAPRTAVEVIIIVMKPNEEASYIDQAMKTGKGISWLMRHPMMPRTVELIKNLNGSIQFVPDPRVPSNLLVSDMALGNDFDFFNLDRWFHLSFKQSLPEDARNRYPFLYAPKPSSSERLPENPHVTVKPVKIISYLLDMFSSPGNKILDPYAGSGTSILACEASQRNCIAMEMTPEYVDFIRLRLERHSISADFISNDSLLPRNNRPQKGQMLTVDAITSLEDVEKISRKLVRHPRNRALFLMGIYSGLKANKLLKLTVSDAASIISAPETNPKLKKAMMKLLEKEMDGGDILFQSHKGGKIMTIQHLNYMVKNWTKSAGLNGYFGARSLEKTYRKLIANMSAAENGI